MRSTLLLVIVFSVQAHASRVIDATNLNTDLADNLGFDVIKTKDKFGLTIELKGPSELDGSCKPLAAGHFVIKNDEEVSAFIGSAHPSEPQSISFIADVNNTELVAFIDYQCESTSKRYTVSSNE